MSPKESRVLILSFPSVWLCQVNSEKEETLTNPERPNRAEMEACPDDKAEAWAGMGAKGPPLIGLEKEDWVCWTWRGDESFVERKEEIWGGVPHLITQQESWKERRLIGMMTPLNV